MANLEDSLARIGGGVAVGDVVGGKYVVEGLLGQGGMGVVLAARQVNLDRLVALKLLPAEAAKDPVLTSRFLREARAAARLQSDHVAKVIDVGTLASGAPFMVMEHLEGADLAQVLVERGRLEVTTACDYVVQACKAVHEAHAIGIVHRDLKPENLYLTTSVGGTSMVKVLDFGVSKVLSSAAGALTSTKTAVGSPMYMAPEQMRGSRETDARADVWALGVVLYELLTARCPFEAETLPDLCLKVVGDPPMPIEAHRPELPAEIVAVVERCLQKDPAGRFANAGELADALAAFVPPRPSVEVPSARRLIEVPSSPRLADTLAETGDRPRALAAASQGSAAGAGTGGTTTRRWSSVLYAAGAVLLAGILGLTLLRRHTPPSSLAAPMAPTSAATTAAQQVGSPQGASPNPVPSAVNPQPPPTSATGSLAPAPMPRMPQLSTPRVAPRAPPAPKPVDDIPAFR